MYDYLAKIILLGPSGCGKYAPPPKLPGDRSLTHPGPAFCTALSKTNVRTSEYPWLAMVLRIMCRESLFLANDRCRIRVQDHQGRHRCATKAHKAPSNYPPLRRRIYLLTVVAVGYCWNRTLSRRLALLLSRRRGRNPSLRYCLLRLVPSSPYLPQ